MAAAPVAVVLQLALVVVVVANLVRAVQAESPAALFFQPMVVL
jgi:hypothetical protein